MATRSKCHALNASFMVLSFATAALLIGVQSSGLLSRATASVASSQQKASPDIAEAAATQPLEQPIEIGIAEILAAAHPVALVHQSRLVVDLSDRQVLLYQDNVLQTSYEIAVGRAGWETPAGDFHVLNLQKNPLWQNPITGETIANNPDNPLGSRWIGFWSDGTHQIGFHGTNQEELIGQAVSHGCIRLRDQDIQALYMQVAIGTPVTVQP